ncbi:nuclear transport factor 2 family protein [uncultured Jatrophihabitans sp.]|uniref:nuclear transport factor 2 family protein n=1 Tax=uncultured Jatrophihabitans sp. TaxID=1610747 RepID=UPI0035C9644D
MTATAVSSREAMIRELCAAADAGDGERFASFFSADATFRFANFDELAGRAAIAASTEATVHAIWPTRHRVDQVAEVGDQLFCRFSILVQPPDVAELSLPCVTVVEVGEDGLITDYRVHMDITPALRPEG